MPSKAVIVEVAETLVEVLNVKFKGRFEAARSYADWNEELTELGELKVDVVPWMTMADLDTTGELEYPVTIDILIRKRFGKFEQEQEENRIRIEAIDEMMLLVEDVWQFLAPCQSAQSEIHQSGMLNTTSYSAMWDPKGTRLMAHYVRPHLKKLRQFTGWIRVGYSVSKAVA